MGNRTIDRATARRLYDDFSRRWRSEKRAAGKYGQPGFRKPTFSQWYAIHDRDRSMMEESTPQDVQEYLGLDPWSEALPPAPTATESTGERGVMTIPMVGGDDDGGDSF